MSRFYMDDCDGETSVESLVIQGVLDFLKMFHFSSERDFSALPGSSCHDLELLGRW